MAKLIWDAPGTRKYKTGVEQCVLYPMKDTVTDPTDPYGVGVAWNGLTAINESPSGAEPTDLFANNSKYISLMSAEKFACTIEAYYSPEEFDACDGSRSLAPGVLVRQQPRKSFGLAYKTLIGNDEQYNEYGFDIRLVYGCLASPSPENHPTVNDTPEATTMSWEVNTTPVPVPGFKPSSTIVINSTKLAKAKLTEIEDILYGTESEDPRLPLPTEILSIITAP